MNIKMVYANRIDAWDTRADGSATTSHAVLQVNGRCLELWSALTFEEGYDPKKSGKAKSSRTEEGKAEAILWLNSNPPQDLAGFLAAAHDEQGLIRLDVDGETIYEFKEPVEEEGEEPEADTIPTVWMPDE